MKLDGVDHLTFAAFDHHLVFAEIGGGEKFKAFGHAFDLQTVILPDAQDVVFGRVWLPDAAFGVCYPVEDRVCRVEDFDKAVLIFDHAGRAFFRRVEIVERRQF